MRLPKPRHCGQAPKGVLNENRMGRGSSKVRPHFVHDELVGERPRRPALGVVAAHDPVGHAVGGLDRFEQARATPFVDFDPVQHDVDRLHARRVLGRRFQLDHFAADAIPRVALAQQLFEMLGGSALLDGARGDDVNRAAARVREQGVDHLVGCVATHLDVVGRAHRAPHAREEQAQVVVDLGGRADGRARAARGVALLDGDRGREARHLVDVGASDALQELLGVGRERLDVAPLSLGVERVEGERRLPGARHTRDDGEAPARDLDVDVLEVVLARTAHDDLVDHYDGHALRARGNWTL